MVNFVTPEANGGSTNTPDVPYHWNTWGLAKAERCVFAFTGTGIGDLLRFWPGDGYMVLDDCTLLGEPVNAIVQAGFSRPASTDAYELRGKVHVLSPTAVYQTNPTITDVGDIKGDVVQVTQGATARTGTIPLTSTSSLQVGDVVHFSNASPTAYQPENFPDAEPDNLYRGPIGRIASIVTDTSVTLEGLPLGFPFATNIRLRVFRWAAA
jgi:hypothetical protein